MKSAGNTRSVFAGARWLGYVLPHRHGSQLGRGREDVPKVALFLCEFDGYFLLLVPVCRVYIDHAAFPLFLGEAIHEKDRLASFDSWCQGQKRAVHVHGFSHRDIAKWQAALGAAVHVNRNRE
jgi:hypothetical protein